MVPSHCPCDFTTPCLLDYHPGCAGLKCDIGTLKFKIDGNFRMVGWWWAVTVLAPDPITLAPTIPVSMPFLHIGDFEFELAISFKATDFKAIATAAGTGAASVGIGAIVTLILEIIKKIDTVTAAGKVCLGHKCDCARAFMPDAFSTKEQFETFLPPGCTVPGAGPDDGAHVQTKKTVAAVAKLKFTQSGKTKGGAALDALGNVPYLDEVKNVYGIMENLVMLATLDTLTFKSLAETIGYIADAECVGAHDGTAGDACKLNSEQTDCAVPGVCTFSEPRCVGTGASRGSSKCKLNTGGDGCKPCPFKKVNVSSTVLVQVDDHRCPKCEFQGPNCTGAHDGTKGKECKMAGAFSTKSLSNGVGLENIIPQQCAVAGGDCKVTGKYTTVFDMLTESGVPAFLLDSNTGLHPYSNSCDGDGDGDLCNMKLDNTGCGPVPEDSETKCTFVEASCKGEGRVARKHCLSLSATPSSCGAQQRCSN